MQFNFSLELLEPKIIRPVFDVEGLKNKQNTISIEIENYGQDIDFFAKDANVETVIIEDGPIDNLIYFAKHLSSHMTDKHKLKDIYYVCSADGFFIPILRKKISAGLETIIYPQWPDMDKYTEIIQEFQTKFPHINIHIVGFTENNVLKYNMIGIKDSDIRSFDFTPLMSNMKYVKEV